MYGGGVQGQTLDVTVVGGRNLKDTEWLSRQDPYVVIEYANQKFRTRTDTDGGRNPSFNEKFTFSLIEGLREFNVNVWNSNSVSLDDFIGSGRIQLERVLSTGYDDNSWTLSTKSGKHAGELRLIMHYDKANKAGHKEGKDKAYGVPPPAGYGYPPQPGYPPAPGGYPGPPHHSEGYPPQHSGGYPSYPAAAGYPPQQHFPPAPGGYPPAPTAGYPPAHGYGSSSHEKPVVFPPPYGAPAPPHAAPIPAGYPAVVPHDKHGKHGSHGHSGGHAGYATGHYGVGHGQHSHGKHKKHKHGKGKGWKGFKKVFK